MIVRLTGAQFKAILDALGTSPAQRIMTAPSGPSGEFVGQMAVIHPALVGVTFEPTAADGSQGILSAVTTALAPHTLQLVSSIG